MPAADRPGSLRSETIIRPWAMRLVLPMAIFVLWAIAAKRAGNDFLLPGPARVWTAFIELWRIGRFIPDLLVSLGRVGLGFLLASLMGMPLGFLAGRSSGFTRIAQGTLNFLRQVPPVALVPMLLLWLGLGEAPKLLVIIYASFFPIFLAAELGAREADPGLIEVGRLYHRGPIAVLRKVVIPAALPVVVTGLRLGLGYGWRSLVVAEMLAAARGMGALIVEARAFGRMDRMLVGVLAIGAAGTILDYALRALERLFTWDKS